MIPDCLDILYEENGCLALNKPSGLTTQAPFPLDSLEARVKDYLRAHDGKLTGRVYLGIPHRLDRVCSGAIVFADNPKAARKLARQFERRQVRKIYWACVQGQVEPASGTWTDFVRKIPEEPRAEVVPADHPEARGSAPLQGAPDRAVGHFAGDRAGNGPYAPDPPPGRGSGASHFGRCTLWFNRFLRPPQRRLASSRGRSARPKSDLLRAAHQRGGDDDRSRPRRLVGDGTGRDRMRLLFLSWAAYFWHTLRTLPPRAVGKEADWRKAEAQE